MPLHVCSALCLRVMLRLLLHRWELGAHHPFEVLLDAETDEHAGAIGFGPTPRQQAQLGWQAGRKATRVRVPALLFSLTHSLSASEGSLYSCVRASSLPSWTSSNILLMRQMKSPATPN